MARAPKAIAADSAPSAPARFQAALEKLSGQIEKDRSILAAILCGSLSHDTVWEKSDIDLVLVTKDGVKSSEEGLALYADGINVHAMLMERAHFRKVVEGAIRSSFQHSFLAKGRLLFTHDETVARLCEQLRTLGERDIAIQLLHAGASALRRCTRRISGWRRGATWSTPRCGFFMPPLPWRRSRRCAHVYWPTAR
ncbi:MAG: nucleotidyltransferase domain-containing protein [Ignavibacteriota bacterium]